MSREQKYTAIILKKQPLNEADEIITCFTREAGKIRGLAKAVKLAKSKLQNNLQGLFLVNLSVAGRGHLPKIIGVEPIQTFLRLRQNLELMKYAFYGSELLLKFTPDGQKNEKLFDLFLNFLVYLETYDTNFNLALAKFKTDFLSAVGFAAAYHQDLAKLKVQLEQCLNLESSSFPEISRVRDFGEIAPLQEFLSDFIVYHLEREVKSERFIKSVV